VDVEQSVYSALLGRSPPKRLNRKSTCLALL